MSTISFFTKELTETFINLKKGDVSIEKAKALTRIANTVYKFARLQLKHAAPTNPLEIGFRNDTTLDIPHEEK